MLNVKFQSYGISLPSLKAPCGIRKEQETKNQSGIPFSPWNDTEYSVCSSSIQYFYV